MKWYVLFIAATQMGFSGPWDTQERCLLELQTGLSSHFGVVDPRGYNGASYTGICIQGIHRLADKVD
jgi:hypothetical protein